MPNDIVNRIKLPNNDVVDINDYRIKIYYELEGSNNYYSVSWDVSDSNVTSYEDKMVVCAKVPIQGTNTSVGFQINNLGYKPVVYDKNTTIGERYPVDSVVWMVYDSSEDGVLYTDYNVQTTVTGCWKVMDYSDKIKIYNLSLEESQDETVNIVCTPELQMADYKKYCAGEPAVFVMDYSTASEAFHDQNIYENLIFTPYSVESDRELYIYLISSDVEYLVSEEYPENSDPIPIKKNYAISCHKIGNPHIRFEFRPVTLQERLEFLDDTIVENPQDVDFLLYKEETHTWNSVTPEVIEITDENEYEYTVFNNAMTDADGNKYSAAKFGDQVFLIQNLRTTSFEGGDSIPLATDESNMDPQYMYLYETAIRTTGLYYNSAVLSTPDESKYTTKPYKKLVPSPWKIPDISEYQLLGPILKNDIQKAKLFNIIPTGYHGTEYWSISTYEQELKPMIKSGDSKSGESNSDSGNDTDSNETSGKKGEKIEQSSDFFDLHNFLYLLSNTTVNMVQLQKAAQYAPMKYIAKLGLIELNEDDVIIKTKQTSQNGANLFCTIRAKFDGTFDEFLEYYKSLNSTNQEQNTETKKSRSNSEEASPVGKYLIRTENSVAWTDISYDNLKNKPFGEICTDTQLPASQINGNVEYNSDDENDMSYVSIDFSDPYAKSDIHGIFINDMVINANDSTWKQYMYDESVTESTLYYIGNLALLAEMDGGEIDPELDTGEDYAFVLSYNCDYASFLTRISTLGEITPDSCGIIVDTCFVKKIDPKYIDFPKEVRHYLIDEIETQEPSLEDNLNSGKWHVDDLYYKDGYKRDVAICLTIPVLSYYPVGTLFSINDNGELPIMNYDGTVIDEKIPVGSKMWIMYDPSRTGTYYNWGNVNNTNGCWVIVSATARQTSAVLRVWTNVTDITK